MIVMGWSMERKYEDVTYPKLDITNLSISEAAKTISTKARL